MHGATIENITVLLQAYKNGEQIQQHLLDDRVWGNIESPIWNFDVFDCKAKPINSKFKENDRLILKSAQYEDLGFYRPKWQIIVTRAEPNIYYYAELAYSTPDESIPLFSNKVAPALYLESNYIKIDDALWYWKFIDRDGASKRFNVRQNHAMAERLLNTHNQKQACVLFSNWALNFA